MTKKQMVKDDTPVMVDPALVEDPALVDDSTVEMDDDLDSGLESFTRTITNLPIISLTQPLTPEVQDDERPDITAGVLMDSMSKAFLGKSVKVHVFRAWRARAKFPPRDSGSKTVECYCPLDGSQAYGTTYGKCTQCPFYDFKTPERCQQQYHLVVGIGDNPDNLYRIILQKTSYKFGKKLVEALDTLKSKEKLPIYNFVVNVSAEKVTQKHIYFVFHFDITDERLDPTLRPAFSATFKEVHDLRQESLEYHQELLARKKAENASIASEESSKDMEDLANITDSDFKLTADDPAAEEDAPF